jgi:hypothetical protein
LGEYRFSDWATPYVQGTNAGDWERIETDGGVTSHSGVFGNPKDGISYLGVSPRIFKIRFAVFWNQLDPGPTEVRFRIALNAGAGYIPGEYSSFFITPFPEIKNLIMGEGIVELNPGDVITTEVVSPSAVGSMGITEHYMILDSL